MNMFEVVFTDETKIFVAANTVGRVVDYLVEYGWLDKRDGKARVIHSITHYSWVEVDRGEKDHPTLDGKQALG